MNYAIDWKAAFDELVPIYSDYKRSKNQKMILKKLEDVQEEVTLVGAKLDEQTIVNARTGLLHLLDGFNSDIDEVKAIELQMARGIFSKLVNLDIRGSTQGITTNIDNAILVCVGYWGNFHYFNYYKDYRNSLIQIYECTQKCPQIALKFFPSTFFSKDYIDLIETTEKELASAIQELEKTDSDNFWKSMMYYGKAGLVGVGLLALPLFIVAPPLIAKNGRKAIGEFVGKKDLTPTEKLKDKVNLLNGRRNDLYIELNDECNKCLDDLRNSSSEIFLASSIMISSTINRSDGPLYSSNECENCRVDVRRSSLETLLEPPIDPSLQKILSNLKNIIDDIPESTQAEMEQLIKQAKSNRLNEEERKRVMAQLNDVVNYYSVRARS